MILFNYKFNIIDTKINEIPSIIEWTDKSTHNEKLYVAETPYYELSIYWDYKEALEECDYYGRDLYTYCEWYLTILTKDSKEEVLDEEFDDLFSAVSFANDWIKNNS